MALDEVERIYMEGINLFSLISMYFLPNRALDEVERIYEEGERARREELRHTHSIFSRISPWLADQLAATHATLMEQHKWRPHEHALALCRQNNLPQHAYFLQRDLSFMREVRQAVILRIKPHYLI